MEVERIALREIVRFQNEKKLSSREFDLDVETLNVLEELLEARGVNDRNVAFDLLGDLKNRVDEEFRAGRQHPVEEDDIIDAFADIIVFSVGAFMKKKYIPELVLQETAKEVNSRIGTIVNGKFIKDTSKKAMALRYKAQYGKAKLLV